MMNNYQVIARRYRPQRFKEVIGQEAIITTLLNAIQMNRVGHAYLFSGMRGTGKTTLARLFSKALNCLSPDNNEPCNACACCKDIASGNSLDVIEIDGASHRGIEEMRKINETLLYSPGVGKYKIFIIDEVHMLTKEAFNALLKSLEEPPAKVKFLFATTEPHKVPATIVSRCQRFQLARIPLEKLIQKLKAICHDLAVTIEHEAAHSIAKISEGSLRDAESLLDQIISFYGNQITLKSVCELLGMVPEERFTALDLAYQNRHLAFATALSEELFSTGCNLDYFLEGLFSHFRTLFLMKTGAINEKHSSLSIYTEEQLLLILEIVVEGMREIKNAFSQKLTLEMILLRIIKTSTRLSFDQLIARLEELEKKIGRKETIMAAPAPSEEKLPLTQEGKINAAKEKIRMDTVMRFAAKELNGTLKT